MARSGHGPTPPQQRPGTFFKIPSGRAGTHPPTDPPGAGVREKRAPPPPPHSVAVRGGVQLWHGVGGVATSSSEKLDDQKSWMMRPRLGPQGPPPQLGRRSRRKGVRVTQTGGQGGRRGVLFTACESQALYDIFFIDHALIEIEIF